MILFYRSHFPLYIVESITKVELEDFKVLIFEIIFYNIKFAYKD